MRSKHVVVAVALACAGACGVSSQGGPELADRKAVPFDLLDRNATTLVPRAAGPSSESVQLCYVRDHRLQVVNQQLASPVDAGDVVDALAEIPPNVGELRTALGGEQLVETTQVVGGVARVDLTPAVVELGGDNQLLAVAQLVCSLTSRPGIGQVSFALSGAPVEVPRADGSSTVGAVARDDYAALIDGAG